jgi:hypothetical protein
MRTYVYNRIMGLALPSVFGSPARVISSGSSEDNPLKPFLIVQFDIEVKPLGMPASARTSRVPFTVWVHDEPGTMLNIDEAAFILKNDLPTLDGAKVGNMSHYGIEWEEIGQDAFDDHFKTNTRPVRFWMMTRRAQ